MFYCIKLSELPKVYNYREIAGNYTREYAPTLFTIDDQNNMSFHACKVTTMRCCWQIYTYIVYSNHNNVFCDKKSSEIVSY